jgi:radical SAM protein with 4Fe4S-binding SPASM domain
MSIDIHAESAELPSFVQIEPVGQCNLRCRMCPIEFRKDGPPNGPPAFMKFEDFTRLIDGFPRLAELHLQGLGEPMMHPRFFDMVAYAVRRGARVTTNSNLTLLNAERAGRCVSSGLDVLHVSIDGATPETYERIRVRSRYDKVLCNLRLLLDARQCLGSTRPHLHMVVVVMRQNLHELPELVRLAHGWQMEEVWVQHLCHDFAESSLPEQYRPMRQFVDGQTLLTDDPARVARYFDEARAEAARVGVRLRLPKPSAGRYPRSKPGRERCDWPWERAYLSYDGRAMPCCTVATPDRANFGSATSAGFAAIWNGPEYQEFRRRLNSEDPPEICRTCAVYNGTF